MGFDNRAAVEAAVGQVPSQVQQWRQGDRNAWNNCVPTACMLGHAAYGESVVDPQRETDAVYGPNYVGGEAFWAAEAWIQANVSDTPGHTYGGGGAGDLGGIAAHGGAGQYVIGFFNCDADATITGYSTGLYHASPIVAGGGGTWVVLNVHDYSDHYFTDTELDAAMAGAGGWVYYEAALPQEGDMAQFSDQEAATLKRWAQAAPDGPGVAEIRAAIGAWDPDQYPNVPRTMAEALDDVFSALGSWDPSQHPQVPKTMADALYKLFDGLAPAGGDKKALADALTAVAAELRK